MSVSPGKERHLGLFNTTNLPISLIVIIGSHVSPFELDSRWSQKMLLTYEVNDMMKLTGIKASQTTSKWWT
jgi:hypothetical protein